LNYGHSESGENSFGPCPADQFSGRFDERERLKGVIQEARNCGQLILISGRRGSGKSSLLNWAENEIENKAHGTQCPAVKKDFLETPGMVFTTYRELLIGLKEHQKFGWFRKSLDDSKVKKSIETALAVLEKMSSVAGPIYGPGVNAAVAVAKGLLPGASADHTQLLSSFLSIFRGLSEEMSKNNKVLAILLDDVQWSSGPDFQLLKDLMRNLPPGIVLIIAFRLEAESEKKYADLQNEIYRYGYAEIRLGGMLKEDIAEFASRRYNFSIDRPTSEFLSQKIGDPLCLVACFNLLKKHNLAPNLINIQEILPQALDTARCIFTGLDTGWQSRINSLCILHPPMYLSVISCMLKEHDTARLKDELDHSLVFISLDKEIYDFAHPSLREYRRKELPESKIKELHSQAAKCLESLEARL
jgi:energy-coupling factor transporter ATP-binding protein EcfA2